MDKNEWNTTKEELKEALEKIQREMDYIHSRLEKGIHSDFWPNRLRELESQRLDKRAILMLMGMM